MTCLRSITLGLRRCLPTVLNCSSTGRLDLFSCASFILHPREFVNFASETRSNANALETERPEHATGVIVVRVSDRVQILQEMTLR